MAKNYEVPVVYRGQITYVVEAEDEEEAEGKADVLFNRGVKPEPLGNEWEEIERFGIVKEVPDDA